MLRLPVANSGVCLISCSLCRIDFGILRVLSFRIGGGSDEPAHVRDSTAHIRYRLRNRLARMLRVPFTDICGVRVCFGVNRRDFVFNAGCALADSLAGVVGLPVANSGVCLVGGVLCCGDFGILRGLSRRVDGGIHFMVCDIPHLFHVCRDGITATVQSSITVSACRLFLLHFLRNGRVGKNVVPVGCIAFQTGQAGSVLCDFCRIVRNIFRVGADVGVLNDLFGFDSADIGFVVSDTVTQRGIGIRTCLRFGGVCRLIGRVKVRNSLLAVGGLLRNGSGVCLLCGLCADDFGVQAGGKVGDVGFNGIKAFAPCRHILFPLNNLFVPAVNQFGETLVVFLELLNQPGQIKDGFLQVCELIVIVGRLDPILCLSFRIRGQLCALRHIALRRVAVSVMDDDS